MKVYRLLPAFLLAWLGLIGFYSCNETKDNTDSKTLPPNSYVGTTKCQSCHKAQFNDWKGSHHDWAMKQADQTHVLGDFDNAGFKADGVSYTFRKESETYWVDIADLDQNTVSYEIAFTFGVSPLQQYLVEFPNGKFQVLRASWDTEKHLWFHQYAGRRIEQNDWLHWTREGQRWNTMCAECHSTDLQKNYDPGTDAFSTSFSEINIGCEACHGKGGHHVDWAKDYDPSNDSQSGDNFIKTMGRSQNSQINQCAPCHSRRTNLTSKMEIGPPFDQQFKLQTLNTDFYHPDGQIDEEDYVFGSFLQSKMYSEGVKCSDCHNPHSLKLVAIGNDLCFQCHDQSYGLESHHFHKMQTEASKCINCHMTGKTYMGNDFRRDHSFRVPRPDQSVLNGTPNACNNCHKEKSPKWASKLVVEWYGPERKTDQSDALLASQGQVLNNSESEKIIEFLRDDSLPFITRASIIENIPPGRNATEVREVLECLKDPSPLVRCKAVDYFNGFRYEERLRIAMEMVNDKNLMVRISVAQLVGDQNIEMIQPEHREAFQRARNEWENMLQANSDFAVGRLNLGDYYLQTRDLSGAIREYRMALKMDSMLIPVYSNLASAFSLSGKNQDALHTLNLLLIQEPEYSRGYYLRGLLYHEMEDLEQSIRDMKKAIKLDPGNLKAYLNLSLIFIDLNRIQEAIEVIDLGLGTNPNDPELIQLKDQLIRRSTG